MRTPGSNINWRNPDSQSDMHPGGETCLMRAAASGKNLVLQVSFLIFQSQKRLYIQKCPSVCSEAKPLNSLKSSFFIIHPSSFFIHRLSFFIHPSFISRLLSFSACFITLKLVIFSRFLNLRTIYLLFILWLVKINQ